MPNLPRFCDFAEEEPFDGEKIRLDDLLNKEILVLNFKVKDSHKKQGTQYATIHFKIGDEPHITFTGSGVILEQLNKYKDKIPFYTTIKKINRYYTFS